MILPNTIPATRPTLPALLATLLLAGLVVAMPAGPTAGRALLPPAAEIERWLSGPDAGPATAQRAYAACRSIAATFDDRDVARFLEQYGRAAARSQEPEVAVVMLARSFLLFPTSRWAPSSLLESARLHRSAFADEEVAQRLARRSLETARALGMPEAAAAAEAFLAAQAPDRPTSPDALEDR